MKLLRNTICKYLISQFKKDIDITIKNYKQRNVLQSIVSIRKHENELYQLYPNVNTITNLTVPQRLHYYKKRLSRTKSNRKSEVIKNPYSSLYKVTILYFNEIAEIFDQLLLCYAKKININDQDINGQTLLHI